MPNGSHDTICNSSPNQTFQDIVDARLSRRGFLGGGLATAATVSVGGVGALLDAVPVSAKSHPPRPAPRLPGHPGLFRRHRDSAARLHRQGAHRVGRSRLGRARLQAGREQQRGGTGAAVGHAQRRRRVFPARSTGWILGPRSDKASDTVFSSRTTSTPTTGCSFRTATPTGQPEKTRKSHQRPRRVGHRDPEGAPRHNKDSEDSWGNPGTSTARIATTTRRVEGRPPVTIRPPITEPDADEDWRTGGDSGVRTRRTRA